MDAYIGAKVILAKECSKEVFDFLKGKPQDRCIPEFETHTSGYHVQYPNLDGTVYDSWSPKEVFENAYRKVIDGERNFILWGQSVPPENKQAE
jgi:hypothetical protein